MAENTTAKKIKTYNLKPIFMLTIAAIIISKAQRAVAKESSGLLTDEIDNADQPICPDYCNLSPDRATRGKAPFRMWFFDPSDGSCRRFRWSGRGGNKNRFYKKVDCEETCSKCTPSEILDDGENPNSEMMPNASCSPTLDEGRCESTQEQPTPQLMWHYNTEKAKCSPFIFYGCGGNSNRFESHKDCEETCH